MKRYILSIIALVLFATTLYAQEQTAAATNDSVPALTKRTTQAKVARRNLHYNILGGPSYTPDFGAVLGGSALMTFRINPSDTTQLRSVVPMAIAFMFNGGINLFSKPQLFFKGDRFRIFGKFSYKNTEENFTASAIIPIKITYEATVPANTDTAACKSTPGSSSGWATAISLPDLK